MAPHLKSLTIIERPMSWGRGLSLWTWSTWRTVRNIFQLVHIYFSTYQLWFRHWKSCIGGCIRQVIQETLGGYPTYCKVWNLRGFWAELESVKICPVNSIIEYVPIFTITKIQICVNKLRRQGIRCLAVTKLYKYLDKPKYLDMPKYLYKYLDMPMKHADT